ncbi:hypothetical protein OA93_15725 [Flavobacterium sp. KMS]|uniref:hypothetical protein n=1 Tax=Flavobacterium sp. KMS TaxID=1566023 RepID=UPI00057E50D4|nr:hypothetical protein [Flavobacterium sp. KMS]KIA97039.1 hypothetical protein OA93_15725 [Flavobacterium sp. KMS]
MNIIINKTHLFFFSTILLILAFAFYKPKGTFDVNIGDTYYIIQNSHLGILLSLIYFILGIIYFFLHKRGIQLSSWIVYMHSIISIGGLILVWFLLKKISYSPQTFEEIIKSIKVNMYLSYTCFGAIMSMILIQIIFMVNVVFKILKN